MCVSLRTPRPTPADAVVLPQDFGHVIHELSFDDEEAYTGSRPIDKARKSVMGISEPLNGLRAHTEKSQFMFQVRDAVCCYARWLTRGASQYFLKVVATELYSTLR